MAWAPGRVGAVLAVLGAMGCFIALPAASFRTHALLIVDGGTVPVQTALIRVAADGAVSKTIIDRAAGLLLASDIKAPAPTFADRLGVTAGTKGATSRQARLAETLAPGARIDPGVVAGTIEISAAASVPEEAARLADALAEAFVTQQDDAAIQARIRQDERAAARVEGAKAAALAARQRLIALGGASLDPVQARNAAAAQTATAESRLASIRAIMASGAPPLSDRKDLPPALALPQAAYLDLKGQLDKQSETLGERHTTIIALQEGVKRAAATLSGEWNRLKKIAETDVVAARENEAVVRKGDTSIDIKRRDAIEDARRAVQMAEDAAAVARKQQDVLPDEATFRLIARAPVPKLANGTSLPMRLVLALLVALAGMALAKVYARIMPRRQADEPAARHDPVASMGDRVASETTPAAVRATEPKVRRSEAPEVAPRPDPVVVSARVLDKAVGKGPRSPDLSWALRPAALSKGPRPERIVRSVTAPLVEDHEIHLVDAMRAVLDTIETMPSRGGIRPTIMVAANEDGLATTSVALALGRAAADRRWHVLLVEAERAAPVLAAAAALDAEPVLIDLYGTLRVGLAADGAGSLTLAPVLRDAARLASNLAMKPLTPLIDDLVSAFDMIVIDGGVAEDAVAAGWTADAFVRVASRPSRHDDDIFCSTFEVAGTVRLATVLLSAPSLEPRVVRTSTQGPQSAPSRSSHVETQPIRARAHASGAKNTVVAPRRKFAYR